MRPAFRNVLLAGAVIGALLAVLAWRSVNSAVVGRRLVVESKGTPLPAEGAPVMRAAPPRAMAQPELAPAATRTGSPPHVDASATPARTEAALMGQLRDVGGSDPELSLRLARDGNEQFKGSADEPERRWYIVKSLMRLARPDEARVEGRALLDQYPDSDWAQDVHRHLFVNPPTHPEERGFGKATELD